MSDATKPRFEESLSQIEKIVAELERGEPGLSEALGKYEIGVKLLRQCYQLLDEAESSVALLTGIDDQGNPITLPYDATATLARDATAPPSPVAQEPKPKSSSRSTASKNRSALRDDSSEIPEAPF